MNDEEQATALIEAQTKVISAAYDKAIAYANLIILAGYAGFFGLWQITKDHLSKPDIFWSAILMLTSISFFVLFEVWKMYYSSRGLLNLASIMMNPANQKSLTRLSEEIEKHNGTERSRSIWFGRIWHFVLVVTIFPAVGAVGIIAFAFIKSICY